MIITKSKKFYYNLLITACFIVYTSTICIKMIYGSEIVEIVAKFGETKARVGLGLTAYYITYAVAQFAITPFVNKINMGRLMVITLSISAVLYGIIPFTSDIYQLWLILALNGVMQASAWGGCMYFLGKYLPEHMVGGACSIMSAGLTVGTVLTYTISPVFIVKDIWQYAFLLFAFIMLISVISFIFIEKRIEKVLDVVDSGETKVAKPGEKQEASGNKHGIDVVMGLAIIVSLCINISYYAVSNWFPSFINDVFGVDAAKSVWLTIILHVLSYLSGILAIALCTKYRKNFFVVSFVFCAVELAIVVIMSFIFKMNIVLSIAFCSLIIALSKGASGVFAIYMPFAIKNVINSGTTALIINGGASIGAAISPTIAGYLVDCFGWRMFFLFIAVVFVLVLALIGLSYHFYRRLKI